MSRFVLSTNAKSSLRGIARYTEKEWGAKQREAYIKEIYICFHDLALFPLKGKLRPEMHEQLRSYHCMKHIVYYVSASDHIRIIDVLHERMEPFYHIAIAPKDLT